MHCQGRSKTIYTVYAKHLRNSDTKNSQLSAKYGRGLIAEIRLHVWQCLMDAHWVGQNSGPIFCHLWNKVHQIKFPCAGMSAVCNAIFQLTMSCCVPEISAIKWRSCVKSRQNFDVFGLSEFGGKRPPKLLTEFYKSGSPSNMWQSLVAIGQATSEIRQQKRRSKLQQ